MCLLMFWQTLNLWDNLIGDAPLPILADLLQSNRVLAALSLARNQITDEGARTLAAVFRAVPVDKVRVVLFSALVVNVLWLLFVDLQDEAATLKKAGVRITAIKSRQFRDANSSLRSLNLS